MPSTQEIFNKWYLKTFFLSFHSHQIGNNFKVWQYQVLRRLYSNSTSHTWLQGMCGRLKLGATDYCYLIYLSPKVRRICIPSLCFWAGSVTLLTKACDRNDIIQASRSRLSETGRCHFQILGTFVLGTLIYHLRSQTVLRPLFCKNPTHVERPWRMRYHVKEETKEHHDVDIWISTYRYMKAATLGEDPPAPAASVYTMWIRHRLLSQALPEVLTYKIMSKIILLF